MISLQSHNQVLYHLTNLFTPRTSNYSCRIRKREVNTKKPEGLREEYSTEAVKNCSEVFSVDLEVKRAGKLTKKQINAILRELPTFSRTSRSLENHDKWRTSYISGASFTENKRGFSCDPLNAPVILKALGFSPDRITSLSLASIPTLSVNKIIQRGFKTERNIKAEISRNPPLISRFRSWIGLSKYVDEKTKLKFDQADLEHLKTVLNDTDLSNDQKQRIKVAFAEGYLAGNDRKIPGRGLKWLKIFQQLTMTIIAFVIIVSLLMGVYKSGANGGMFRIQLGNVTVVDPEEIHVTFDDVKGVKEAKDELTDIVEFLKNPEKFSALGGKLPKGVLLVGPPGTGKTLLARAVAGEARVPFFHAAGPEFDEVLVGQGARRIRELFKAAKERAPCVVFIDEIDSVGGKRTASLIHPYANQTVNQLLSEMDGFHQNEGVIVLGATNRRDDLDQALRRPGRFDVEVYVHKPDLKGRKEILELYLAKILTKTVDVDRIARSTTGFTGADIETMINQAALRAAIEGAEYVSMDHLEKAREKVLLGPEMKGRMPDSEENKITAYHEAGHALVGYYSKEANLLNKVTIIPRSGSLGHTSYLPKKDIYHTTKAHLLATMDTMLGGRVAEEIVFGVDKVTTGASDDLQKATQIAEAMVKNYGMSEKVGFRSEVRSNQENTEYSPSTTEIIDLEVKRLLQESYDRAKNILVVHSKEHKLLAEALLKYETLDIEEIKQILNNKKIENISEKMSPILDVPTNVI